ncbi:hypothetical protein [Nocardia wallacei]|uniref:hypothetical protein n=1 Tax=Nocardia wallacei TaxID=480035 RepID=UPI002458AA2C|nr:hypothetical protein [Nocardia wallacei]
MDRFDHQVDVDNVHVSTAVQGSFRIKYWDHIDRVCVHVGTSLGNGDMTMQLTLDQAVLLRTLLDAGIADAVDASSVHALPAGGDAA